jgi:hypothetical protein
VRLLAFLVGICLCVFGIFGGGMFLGLFFLVAFCVFWLFGLD